MRRPQNVRSSLRSSTARFRGFYGIPYAAPPIGPLRWRPPAPAEAWSGTLNATAYKPSCVQTSDFTPEIHAQSEDCLYLNVFTPPRADATSRLPVLFWVHGGAYVSGGADESRLNGTWSAHAALDQPTSGLKGSLCLHVPASPCPLSPSLSLTDLTSPDIGTRAPPQTSSTRARCPTSSPRTR